ncbi:uncharacterized [Tachysurus ichikawai]
MGRTLAGRRPRMLLLGTLIKSAHNEPEMKESRRREGAALVDVGDLTISRGVVEHESELLISSFPCLTFLSSSSPGQRPWLLKTNNDADLKSYFAEFPPFSTSLPPPPSVFLAVSPLPQCA